MCTSVQMYMATFMPARQKVWVGAIQRRVSIISTALKSMKSVKMLGLSEVLANSLQKQRERELDLSRDFRWLIVWLNVVGKYSTLCRCQTKWPDSIKRVCLRCVPLSSRLRLSLFAQKSITRRHCRPYKRLHPLPSLALSRALRYSYWHPSRR